MTASAFIKPVPKSIAIFGASGHMGGPMARFLNFHAPQVKLRLLASSEAKAEKLRQEHPYAEVMRADYFDLPSLETALAGIEGLFVITTSGLDETRAMNNLVAAVRKHGCLIHMIRIVGLQPDLNQQRIPQAMRDYGMGLEIQHPIARKILDDADMPVTYLNMAASFMDNALRWAPQIKAIGKVVWHDRPVTYIDPREVGEAAARLLLSDDARHISLFYSVNNGEAPRRVSEVLNILSDVLLRRIDFDGSRAAFMAMFQKLVERGLGKPGIAEYLWNMFEFEEHHGLVWVPNQFMERTLGRQPITMRAWMQEHRHHFLQDGSTGAPAK